MKNWIKKHYIFCLTVIILSSVFMFRYIYVFALTISYKDPEIAIKSFYPDYSIDTFHYNGRNYIKGIIMKKEIDFYLPKDNNIINEYIISKNKDINYLVFILINCFNYEQVIISHISNCFVKTKSSSYMANYIYVKSSYNIFGYSYLGNSCSYLGCTCERAAERQ